MKKINTIKYSDLKKNNVFFRSADNLIIMLHT